MSHRFRTPSREATRIKDAMGTVFPRDRVASGETSGTTRIGANICLLLAIAGFGCQGRSGRCSSILSGVNILNEESIALAYHTLDGIADEEKHACYDRALSDPSRIDLAVLGIIGHWNQRLGDDAHRMRIVSSFLKAANHLLGAIRANELARSYDKLRQEPGFDEAIFAGAVPAGVEAESLALARHADAVLFRFPNPPIYFNQKPKEFPDREKNDGDQLALVDQVRGWERLEWYSHPAGPWRLNLPGYRTATVVLDWIGAYMGGRSAKLLPEMPDRAGKPINMNWPTSSSRTTRGFDDFYPCHSDDPPIVIRGDNGEDHEENICGSGHCVFPTKENEGICVEAWIE